MSRVGRGAWETSGAPPLEPDIGPIDEGDCGTGHCDNDAVYRVAWPHFGGDEALCSFHLARFCDQHPELWEQMRALDVDDPDTYAVRGQRFVSIDEVPDQISVDGERMNRVALGVDGLALYDSAEPEGETVRFVTVDRRLDPVESVKVERKRAGEFVAWYRDHEGVYRWDPDAQAALYGGDRP
ncbi:hypothetical protein [Halorubrum tebenquichense]|uniref:Uncharacterized protein n=1 Tax=Halorubrum tebenquichense DSM 14210 TaxID=1227485 RepID=M0DW10_9EURY|nr:hypothetical protein [Halorubrum tebenquichense]ELZ38897.1 hypothetical protein C472_05773 [Halorubrum tebenquichense DSM 14210]